MDSSLGGLEFRVFGFPHVLGFIILLLLLLLLLLLSPTLLVFICVILELHCLLYVVMIEFEVQGFTGVGCMRRGWGG